MKISLSMKTLYRSCGRTLLTFLLLTVVTFALFFQVVEYAITSREMNNAAEQYIGVGAAEAAEVKMDETYTTSPIYIYTDPRVIENFPEEEKEFYLGAVGYKTLTREQIGALSELPYVTSVDTRYMTAGVSDTYYRLDDGEYFYNYSARCVIEGTLTDVRYNEENETSSFNYLKISDCELLAGNTIWKGGQEELLINAWPEKNSGGGLGRLSRSIISIDSSYKYDTEYVQGMTIGGRYVFVLRFDPLTQIGQGEETKDFYLSDHLSNPWCDAVWSIDNKPADYLGAEEFAPLSQLIEITNSDIHTFDMVYTRNMDAIMRFANGSMAMLSGRGLTPQDSADELPVCVVSDEFATTSDLAVGDTITMKLGTELFHQHKGLGTVAAVPVRYKAPEKEVTLEIVGIYINTDGPSSQKREPYWNYSINTIFVPEFLLPLEESALTDYELAPAEFSFVVENAEDIPRFIEEAIPVIEELGLTPIFYDDGWPEIASGFSSAKKLSIVKIGVLTAAIIMATWFAAFLFVGRKKKEYAIMRALGTPKGTSARSLILPLMLISVVSVLIGSSGAILYTLKTSNSNNTLSALGEVAINTKIPVGVVIGCILGEIALTLLIAIVLIRRIGKRSPLALLHDNNMSRGRKNTVNKESDHRENMAETSSPLLSEQKVVSSATVIHNTAQTAHKGSGIGFVLRYIWRHMRRSAGKSVLMILLTALFLGLVGQLDLMKYSYVNLIETTVIKTNFVGGLQLGKVRNIVESGYIIDPYYEATMTLDLNESGTRVVYTNNITRYIGEETIIEYADTYDSSVMDGFGESIVLGEKLMADRELELGDSVRIAPVDYLVDLQNAWILRHSEKNPNDGLSSEEILVLYQDEIAASYDMKMQTFTIVGVASTTSGMYNDTAFSPGSFEISPYVGTLIKLDAAEFTLSDNMKTEEFRELATELVGSSLTGDVEFIMDLSKLENLKNASKLLDTLYPVSIIAALLIGGFLCALVIMQTSKEAAIMRIQGTTKGKTRLIIVLEQILLSIIGLVIGTCGLLIYHGSSLTAVADKLWLFGALYFTVMLIAAAGSAWATTRRNLLDLLQTKE